MYPYIHIFDRTIGSYGLMITLACMLVYLLAFFNGKRVNIAAEDILIVGAMSIGSALLGSSLLYVLVTYSLEQIWEWIKAGSFSFLGSGLVFYGGLIGGIFGALLGVRLAKCDIGSMETCLVPYLPLGHAVGRIGCVLAGCCHGMEYEGPLAIYYPHSLAGVSPAQGYFPVQIVEAALNIGICLCLYIYAKKKRPPFMLLLRYLQLYAVARFSLEFLRGDSVRGIYYGLSVSQWISIGILVFAVGMSFVINKKRKATAEK